jgi:hypothetical protein
MGLSMRTAKNTTAPMSSNMVADERGSRTEYGATLAKLVSVVVTVLNPGLTL